MNDTGSNPNDVMLTAPQVRVRYGGRSDMWLWRTLQRDPLFPRPIVIGGHRYFRMSELVAYENERRAPDAVTS
jgi:hypothetical protein